MLHVLHRINGRNLQSGGTEGELKSRHDNGQSAGIPLPGHELVEILRNTRPLQPDFTAAFRLDFDAVPFLSIAGFDITFELMITPSFRRG